MNPWISLTLTTLCLSIPMLLFFGYTTILVLSLWPNQQ